MKDFSQSNFVPPEICLGPASFFLAFFTRIAENLKTQDFENIFFLYMRGTHTLFVNHTLQVYAHILRYANILRSKQHPLMQMLMIKSKLENNVKSLIDFIVEITFTVE